MAFGYLLVKVRPGFERHAWLAIAALSQGDVRSGRREEGEGRAVITNVVCILGEYNMLIEYRGPSEEIFEAGFWMREELGRRRLVLDTRTYLGRDEPFSADRLTALVDGVWTISEPSRAALKGLLSESASLGYVPFFSFSGRLTDLFDVAELERLLKGLVAKPPVASNEQTSDEHD